jgi:hypothetical protein
MSYYVAHCRQLASTLTLPRREVLEHSSALCAGTTKNATTCGMTLERKVTKMYQKGQSGTLRRI